MNDPIRKHLGWILVGLGGWGVFYSLFGHNFFTGGLPFIYVSYPPGLIFWIAVLGVGIWLVRRKSKV